MKLELSQFLEDTKSLEVLGIYDLAEVASSPDQIYKILGKLRRDVFLPNQRIVFYSQYNPSTRLISHIHAAAQLIDIGNSFILFLGVADLSEVIDSVCHADDKFSNLIFPVQSHVLEDHFTLPESFCPIPWNNLEVRVDGSVFPCCMCVGSPVGKVESGLDNIFKNESMIQLRQDFLDGKKPTKCNSCWKQEKEGLVSNRLRHRSYLLKDTLIQGLDNRAIKQLDLKFGKTCNFKCRICSSDVSSAFAQEEAKFKNIKFVIDENWSENVDHLEDLVKLLPTLVNIDMYGGEPWLLKSFAKILKIAVDNGYSKNIRLHYNTNGSVYPANLIKYWPFFREVDIHFSIDALGDKFALERGSSWEIVENNIVKIKNLNLPNLRLAVMPAINIMNVFYLDEVLSWANDNKFVINPQYVLYPHGFALSQLTKEAKTILIEKFKDHNWPEMRKILDHIQRLPDSDGKEFIKLTQHFDSLRNENFSRSHPEIAKAMGYVYNN